MDDRKVYYELLRTDFGSFLRYVFGVVDGSNKFMPGWYIEVVIDELMRMMAGETHRLIINLPPRYLKSIMVSVALPAWILAHDPKARIICASYTSELAEKLALDCRRVMEDDIYKLLFPQTRLSKEKRAVSDFMTTQGGGRFSTSVGGTLTGRGGNWLIIDDATNPDEAMSEKRRNRANDWFYGTANSRLDDKKHGNIIIMMQRLHQDDLVGHVLEREDWTHLSLPAIAPETEWYTLLDGRVYGRNVGEALHPERESIKRLQELEGTVGGFVFQSQYQQQPVPECGNLIKWEWFQTYEELPPPKYQRDRYVQSWDTALSVSDNADYSVCTTWAVRDKSYYLVDVYRERMEVPALKRKIIELRQLYKVRDMLIEDVGAASALIQQFRHEGPFRPIAIKPEGSKEDRMAGQAPVIEAGNIFIPSSASWLVPFRSEFLAFPSGKHDDQVDSVSQFLIWISRPRAGITRLHVKI